MSLELLRLHQQIAEQGPEQVSVVGAISNQIWKPVTLIGGITTFSVGFLLTLFTSLWVKPQS